MKAPAVVVSAMLIQFSYSAFVLLHPPTDLGITDGSLAPCDEQDIRNRRNSTDYPESGLSFQIRSNETSARWKLEYNTDFQNITWKSLLRLDSLYQHSSTEFCLPSVEIPKNMIGTDAVIRIMEESSSGTFYQVCKSTYYEYVETPLTSTIVSSSQVYSWKRSL